MTGFLTENADAALHRFADASIRPEERRAALTALITSKTLPKQANDPAVALGRRILLSQALDAPEPFEKLLAIAESIRLGQVVKRWAREIIDDLRPAFVCDLPDIQLLNDADDRLNFARACRQMSEPWLPAYLARAIAQEETGEKARVELVSALLGNVSSLSEGLVHLAASFKSLKPGTEFPGDSVARRLTRMLSALREHLLESELDAGDELGAVLHDLVAAPFFAIGKPVDEKVQVELSREVLLTVHDMVRTRISVIADPSMYRAVEYCRKLCGGGTWPIELKKPLERLVTDVTEALVLLGRQGMRDQALLAQLDVLCNYPERARAVARDLVVRHPELPEEVRDWLERGRIRVAHLVSESATEALVSNADESIGIVLHASRQARSLRDGLHTALISSLEVYEPKLASVTQELLNRVQVIAIQMEQVAIQRGIDLYGVPGEEIDMSTKFFTVVSDSPRQRMVVKQPAIIRKRDDGGIGGVITKGLVE